MSLYIAWAHFRNVKTSRSRFPVRISISDANDGNNIVFGSCLNGLSIADLTTCKNLRDIENSKNPSNILNLLYYL